MLVLPLLFLGSAQAFTPPIGWTSAGPDRALRDASDPSLGEIREICLSAGAAAPGDLVKALEASGINAILVQDGQTPGINLEIPPDSVGRARPANAVPPIPGKTCWHLLTATREVSRTLDSDAVLASLQPHLPMSLWGAGVEILPAGQDGSRWTPTAEDPWQTGATPVETDPANQQGWTGTTDDLIWVPVQGLCGLWTGQKWEKNLPVRVRLRLEISGRARIEKECKGKVSVQEGIWGIQGDKLRISPYTASPMESTFKQNDGVLILTLEGQNIQFVHN